MTPYEAVFWRFYVFSSSFGMPEPEYEGISILRNASNYLPIHTAFYFTRYKYSAQILQKGTQISCTSILLWTCQLFIRKIN